MGITDWFSSSSASSSRSGSPDSSAGEATMAAINAPPAAAQPNKFVTAQNPTGIKPCCACPNTKMKRDDCFLANGPGSDDCADLVAAHRKCMENLGFKI